MPQPIIGDISGGIIYDAAAGNPVVGVKCIRGIRTAACGHVLLPAVAETVVFVGKGLPGLGGLGQTVKPAIGVGPVAVERIISGVNVAIRLIRSEEHTSELQSLA